MLSLRIKYASTLLAAMFVLVSGCRKPSERPKANKAFDIPQAMTMFYGNYDVKMQTSVALLPKENGSLPVAGEEQMTIKVLFNGLGGDADAQRFVLVTYAVPTSGQAFDCHACAPTIGMAVFSRKEQTWNIDASNRVVTFSGQWGKPPTDIELVQIGPNHQAVKVMDIGGGQGETTAVLQLLIPWNDTVNLGLERIIADDDKGGCDSSGGLPCYANYRTLTFVPKDKVEYYDLELKLAGTDLPVSHTDVSRRAREVKGLETFRFENGKYVQVSRQGDLTYVETSTGKRENP